ncbi:MULTISPECIES: outer membrane protein [Aeromonas]|uniref:outer membrane protein n=1 Tax=Aeromonas TaxID=642 RepID=UPI0012EFE91E|nr:outer membrane beta-barrel protein [Aeromonas salmonicida]VXA81194.1 exported hypothetical protein [Aeromonas salmonicida]
MKKFLISSVILASGVVFVVPVQAAPHSGLYIGAGFGYGKVTYSGDEKAAFKELFGSENPNQNKAISISLGYDLPIAEQWTISPEISAIYFGGNDLTYSGNGSSAEVKTRYYNIDALGVLTYQLTSYIDVFAKAGVSYKTETHKLSDAIGEAFDTHDLPSDERNKLWTPTAGVGIGYNFTSHWQANLAYMHSFEKGDYHLDSVLAGIKYKF